MHIFFSGIGGAAIGPLAQIALHAGYDVSGSDKQASDYVDNLRSKGITSIHIGQTTEAIAELHKKNPIDWIVYSSAIPKENPDHPELVYARDNNITATKRDDFLNKLLEDTGQKMIAVAGTHGKTTTTAMILWLMHQLHIPTSYSVGGKLSFGDTGVFDSNATYFVYEADEYDRNFLSFAPILSVITGIAYDHPDIYPTSEAYNQAFIQFMCNTGDAGGEVFAYNEDLEYVDYTILQREMHLELLETITLPGYVNRRNALLAVNAVHAIHNTPRSELVTYINQFPGVSRRFEKISENLYTDYAHTPEKISGALQLTKEVAGDDVVVVYEGLHNTRQHFIKKELTDLFKGVKKLYIVPSYLAREDESLEMLTPEKLCAITQEPPQREPMKLDNELKATIDSHTSNGDLVLCLTAGGGNSLDEWLRKEFKG